MSAVDLTKCQPGDLLKMRCGELGVYVRNKDGCHAVSGDTFEARLSSDGRLFWKQAESEYDVVAIIHPTRSELEEQRRELLVCLSLLHSAVNAECPSILDEDRGGSAELAIRMESAIARAEATHE